MAIFSTSAVLRRPSSGRSWVGRSWVGPFSAAGRTPVGWIPAARGARTSSGIRRLRRPRSVRVAAPVSWADLRRAVDILDAAETSVRSERSRWSVLSTRSFGSVASAGSVLSLGSAGSVLSAGSLLSIGSVGSILSIGSAGSILSIGSAGGFCTTGARQARATESAADVTVVPGAVVRRISGLLAVAAIVAAPFGGRRAAA